MQKKIIIFYSIIVVLGLVSEVFLHYGQNYTLNILKSQTGFVNLEIMGLDWYKLNSNPGYQDINCIHVLFYLVLLIGVLQYASDSKKSGLIRFGASVLFLSLIIHLLFWIATLSYLIKAWTAWGWWTQAALSTIVTIFLIWVHYAIIRHLNSDKKLKTIERLYRDNTVLNLVTTDKIQRFLHLFIDVLFTILILSPMLHSLIRINELNFIPETLENIFGERGALWIIIAVFRLIYYTVSEGFLQASPSKFLTGSRVVDPDGEKVKPVTIVLRTLSRFIPFEAFSFLGGHDGWHDRFTDTHVVKEE